MACGYATELSPAQVRSKEPAEAQRQVLRYAISRRLTAKLRGRPRRQAALRSNEALQALPVRSDRRRGRTLSPGARVANQTTPHGPLERLLEVTFTTTTVRVRPQCRKRGRLSLQLKRAHPGDQRSRLTPGGLTEAGWARAPPSIRDAAGRTCTRMRRTKTPAERSCQQALEHRPRQTKAFLALRDA
jgi:hypothetical protein